MSDKPTIPLNIDMIRAGVARLEFPPSVHPPEGFSNWDLPNSTMANATVASQAAGVDGQTLTVTYKDGEKKIIVPPSAEIITYKKANRLPLVTIKNENAKDIFHGFLKGPSRR